MTDTLIEEDFSEVLAFIEEETGIRLPETAHKGVKTYLSEKLDTQGLTIKEFLKQVKEEEPERAGFLNAVTIGETYFFREEKHFRVLEKYIFPALAAEGKGPRRLLSAACSTGEEALSLAALACGFFKADEYRVFAGDINPLALERFKQARYGRNSFREDGKTYHSLLTPHLSDCGKGFLKVLPSLLGSISMMGLNLHAKKYETLPDGMDVVFIRNTLIYMRQEVRQRVVERLSALLKPEGFLFLSSAEIPLHSHPELILEEREGTYFFRKKTTVEKKSGLLPSLKILEEISADNRTSRPPEPAKSRKNLIPDIAKVFEQATLRLNNPLYRVDDETFKAALKFLEATFHLNEGRIVEAEALVALAEKRWGINELSRYLAGMAALSKEDEKNATDCFYSALIRDPRFWPARLKTAMLAKSGNTDKAFREFSLCLKDINEYMKEGRFEYQFLLEGFNARYFAGICEGWMKKLRDQGGDHGA